MEKVFIVQTNLLFVFLKVAKHAVFAHLLLHIATKGYTCNEFSLEA